MSEYLTLDLTIMYHEHLIEILREAIIKKIPLDILLMSELMYVQQLKEISTNSDINQSNIQGVTKEDSRNRSEKIDKATS